jgi:hypothetical protein
MVAALLVLMLVTTTPEFYPSATGNRVPPANGKIEMIGPLSDAAASEALRGVLEPKGYRITLADGSAWCDIWLRASLPVVKEGPAGATYSGISESALVGVITFAKQATDFRGQALKPGPFTLRYALHPVDGNHMGISPIRDFLLMMPVADDKDPNTVFKFEELVKASSKSSSTNHASALSLVSPSEVKSYPSVFENEVDHVVFATKIKNASGVEVPLAFVVKGVGEQ